MTFKTQCGALCPSAFHRPAEFPFYCPGYKGLEKGGSKDQEACEGCPLLEIYTDQKERGRESLSHILWTFYPSFTTVFVINKYDTYAFCLESSAKEECHTAWVTFHVLWTGELCIAVNTTGQ